MTAIKMPTMLADDDDKDKEAEVDVDKDADDEADNEADDVEKDAEDDDDKDADDVVDKEDDYDDVDKDDGDDGENDEDNENRSEDMEAISWSNKRCRNDEDSSDDNESHSGKKNRLIPLSPNRFLALVDEAANVPLPPERAAAAIDLTPCEYTPRTLAENTPLHSFSESESLIEDTNPDNLTNPDDVDDLQSRAMHNETPDSPLSRFTPNRPRVDLDSQSSSSRVIDPFTLAITSKRTRPNPVVGSSRKSSL